MDIPRTIEEFLEELSPGDRTIVIALRDTVRATIPHAEESMLWGSLSYHRPEEGGKIKGAVCMITARPGEVRLDFIHGVRLADPHHLLRGDRKSKRYIPIRSIADTHRPAVIALIRAASKITFND